MKFLYGYKTSENETRDGCINASSRDDAFARLKRMGIKPFKVSLAPGFFNRISSFGWRGGAIALLALGLTVAMVVIVSAKKEIRSYKTNSDERTRRQVQGDALLIARGIRNGWDFVFPAAGEQFLASFAIPGVRAGLRSVDEAELKASLDRHVLPAADDSVEVRQIKSMVEGLKDEAREYIRDGGTIREYADELVKRQEAELAIYSRVVGELEELKNSGVSLDDLENMWLERNEELKNLGIGIVPFPENF